MRKEIALEMCASCLRVKNCEVCKYYIDGRTYSDRFEEDPNRLKAFLNRLIDRKQD